MRIYDKEYCSAGYLKSASGANRIARDEVRERSARRRRRMERAI